MKALLFLLLSIGQTLASFQSVTWYINSVYLSNIPSFDTGKGDFDGSNSDPYITATKTVSGTTTTLYTSSYTTNAVSLSACSTTYYYYSSYTYKTPSGCISMGSTDADLFSTSSFKINLYDHNTNSADQLITSFDMTSAAVSCRTSCLSKVYTYKTSPVACSCSTVTQYANVSSKTISFTYTPVMWLYIDSVSLFVKVFLPIIIGLSFLSPILEKLMFSRNSSWKWVPVNILYLLFGGLPTAVIWTIIGCAGRWLFGDSDWGNYQFSFIRFQVAPFGKSMDIHPRGGRCSCNNGGFRLLYTWPITILWGVLMYVHLILQFVLTLALTVSFVFVPFGIMHAKCLAFQFQLRKITAEGDTASPNEGNVLPQFASKPPPAQNTIGFQAQVKHGGAQLMRGQGPQANIGPYNTAPVPPSYDAGNNPDIPAYLREGENDQPNTSAPSVPPPPVYNS
jgi:uncharacterized membrane protein YccF (DUF307 family)